MPLTSQGTEYKRTRVDADIFTVPPPEGICNDCCYFLEHQDNLDAMNKAFGSSLFYDRNKCWEYCWKRAKESRTKEIREKKA
jgi:hypothetical protein